jgi:signal transduction histidine kinase
VKKTDNYIFAASYSGRSLTYPAKGKNVYHITDLRGKKVVQELIKTAQKGGGYVEYIVPIGKDKEQRKISYVTGVDDWNMYVGTGENLSYIDKEINYKKEELLNSLYKNITITSILGLIFLLIYYIVFHKFKSPLELDIKNLITSIASLVNESKPIKTEDIKFKEFEEISIQTNKLLDQKKSISNELKNKEALLFHQSKMAAMGEMLENIAHQWRQPLSVITTSTSSIQLKQELELLEEDFLQESIESILENAEYLSHTIEDFRNFFQKDKVKEEFQLKELILKTLKLVNSKFKHQKITVLKEFEDITLKTYKNELIQVILVLLHNAKDALENLDDQKRFIFIKTYKDESFAYLEIKDNAKGIEDDVAQKIFDPYFTTKHKSQGTGIGLYMANEIITKHMDGEIFIQNSSFTYDDTEQSGAVFTIKIPL